MQGRDGMNGGAGRSCRSRPRQAAVTDLAFSDQLGEGVDGVLDGGLRIDAVLVAPVDLVDTEPPEGPLDRGADVRPAAVEVAGPAGGV
jgi:hypothetical protein